MRSKVGNVFFVFIRDLSSWNSQQTLDRHVETRKREISENKTCQANHRATRVVVSQTLGWIDIPFLDKLSETPQAETSN